MKILEILSITLHQKIDTKTNLPQGIYTNHSIAFDVDTGEDISELHKKEECSY